jgi:hypothetical protein
MASGVWAGGSILSDLNRPDVLHVYIVMRVSEQGGAQYVCSSE